MKRLDSYLQLNIVGYGETDDTDFPQELQISNGDKCVWYVPQERLAGLRAEVGETVHGPPQWWRVVWHKIKLRIMQPTRKED